MDSSSERVAKDSDELLRLMEEDELQDAAEQEYLPISVYAKLRHTTPQSVHYYIRNRRLKKYKCQCGRFLIKITEADEVFKFKTGANVDHDEESQGD